MDGIGFRFIFFWFRIYFIMWVFVSNSTGFRLVWVLVVSIVGKCS